MKQSTGPVTATSAPLVRLLGTGPAHVSLDHGVLRFGDAQGTPVGAIDSIQTRRSWFWTRLTVREAAGAEHSIGGLAREEAERLHTAVLEDVARVARALGTQLTQLDDRLTRLHASSRYARESQASGLQADIASTVERGGGALTRGFLPAQVAEALARLQPVARLEAYEAAREAANARFVAAAAPAVARAALDVLASPPTPEQAAAIATDEDATLVLAGAGTGKTAVITGKIAHLVRNRGVPPYEILVLAFNRKAAQEIRERLPDDLAGVHVSTFHAFGRRVIADVEAAPTISRLAEDEAMLPVAIDRILVDLLDDPRQSRVVADFITRHRADYRSHFDFKTPGEYYDHVRRSELRTLNGDLVKSFEELEIANFLTQNGISFRYERPYPVETVTPRHRQYRPDFYLPDHDIYIEHFALDRQNRAPGGWTGYVEGVGWKRDIHQQYGTKLIETYSWQQREGVLRLSLRKQLEEEGVTFQRVPIRTLLLELGRWLISWLAQLIATFLNHVKTSGVSAETLRKRARESRDPTRSEAFLDLFEQVNARYDRLLGEDKDFHDLINHAAAHIRNGRWQSPYRYVVVDEFQDISAGRMALLQALKRPGVAYFLVGDDWQSIYRFAGSDVALVRECGRFLGHVRERALSRTFRFARAIMEPSTAFVVRNPAQTQRTLRPARGVRDGGVTVIASDAPAPGLRDALSDIEACEDAGGPPVSVLVLGRYRRSKGALPGSRRGRLRLEFSTVHAAKGREADYVVVLDLRDARLGFPAQHEEDPLLDLVLPPPPGGSFRHAEERRLFYVAMTRARRGTYLVADSRRPSAFVNELLRESPGLRRLGEFKRDRTPTCPRCRTGRLDVSSTGQSMTCLNAPFCRYRAPRCQTCRRGFVTISGRSSCCTNPSCNATPPVCETCRAGVMVIRRGRPGRFLGCTQFASDHPCTNTQKLPRRN
ncbi:MAG: UvrD-helicase domain-containing protein [Chloroflexi bacterium]|nr:UvrD-helicase domain-containing protein [Chloroflexota bacterium]